VDNWYKIVTPDNKTAKKFGSPTKIVPAVGDFTRVDGNDYKVGKVTCEYDFDSKRRNYVIYLDNI
jgi:hypothetical protein